MKRTGTYITGRQERENHLSVGQNHQSWRGSLCMLAMKERWCAVCRLCRIDLYIMMVPAKNDHDDATSKLWARSIRLFQPPQSSFANLSSAIGLRIGPRHHSISLLFIMIFFIKDCVDCQSLSMLAINALALLSCSPQLAHHTMLRSRLIIQQHMYKSNSTSAESPLTSVTRVSRIP